MRFPMRLQCEQRGRASLPDELEQGMEVDITLPHGKVTVTVAMVVMEVNLKQLLNQCRQPVHQRRMGKTVLVAHIKTEAQVPRW